MSTYSAPNSSPQVRDPRTFLGHPVGLFLLFLVEMWERFSYYGMRGLLMLYLITVIAANQLKPGVYTNTLEFEERAVGTSAGSAQSQPLYIAIAQSGFTAPADGASTSGSPVLKISRLKKMADSKADSGEVWVPDADVSGPIVVSGQAGAREFANGEFGFQVSNPTDQPVRLNVQIKRVAGANTYFTLNDNPGGVSTEIKPDKLLGKDDKQFQVIARVNTHDSGRNWLRSDASVLYGWYTGLAYLFPILGGIIADKLIGTHRSMLVGGVLISIGHIILGISGFGGLAQSAAGMSLFMMGLAVIVLGTGHFKPTVSVMVGQLYEPGDPRRDGAFTIFYMGINLGAFICAFVCGTLGEKVGWHWGFGSAAVGMLLGLGLYLWGRPRYLAGVGEAPKPNANSTSALFFVVALAVAAGFAVIYHLGAMAKLGELIAEIQKSRVLTVALIVALFGAILAWVSWFVAHNAREDRGPVVTIFVFMLFNAFFWIAFEQAGSSLNLFTEQNTNRYLLGFEVPATWFQSVNAGLIFILAPIFAGIWTSLGRRRLNPSQPVKIALGLIFLGLGYVFMVVAGQITIGGAAKASMFYILATYFWHTVGELCLSPTGLSYVTKAAPVRYVSLLMGIWFISSFIANLGGGLVASLVEDVERGTLKLPWSFGGQADFFFLFVVSSIGAGVLILLLTPLLKMLMRHPED